MSPLFLLKIAAIVALALGSFGGIQSCRLAGAQRDVARAEGQRDVAREELRTVGLALEEQRKSTKDAADSADRCMVDYQASNHTYVTAIKGLNADARRHRLQQRKCDNVAAVSERLGTQWPMVLP